MKQALQIELLDELLQLNAARQPFANGAVQPSPISRYNDASVFDAEMATLFKRRPQVAAHTSEMAGAGDFLTREIGGQPVLLTRDQTGQVHAFLNVCRHRGARLVGESSGCKQAFSCPYHAWTWSHTGQLLRIRQGDAGFPGLSHADHALRRLPVSERLGLIWVVADPSATPDFDAFTAPLTDEFESLHMADLAIATSDTLTIAANWKLIIEGGIEAYHFKVAHRDTIGPHFLDNLSSYRMLGAHMRSVLPRSTLPQLVGTPRDQWVIRDHANVLYNVFPGTQFLVMQDHIAWVAMQPLAVDQCRVTITILAPKGELTPARQAHWARNQAITLATLREDFEVNVGVQQGLNSGANTELLFGRFEGALHAFNTEVERAVQQGLAAPSLP